MIELENTSKNAIELVNMIKREKITPIFDLDEVIFCAKKRQKLFNKFDVAVKRCDPDQIGQLDLEHYRENSTLDQISQDKNLPLIQAIHMLNNKDIAYHVATARVICSGSKQLLTDRGVYPKVLISRNGDQDNRRDDLLKEQGIIEHFPKCTHSRLLMIDDNLRNCTTLARLGLKVIRIIAARSTLNIRELI